MKDIEKKYSRELKQEYLYFKEIEKEEYFELQSQEVKKIEGKN